MTKLTKTQSANSFAVVSTNTNAIIAVCKTKENANTFLKILPEKSYIIKPIYSHHFI